MIFFKKKVISICKGNIFSGYVQEKYNYLYEFYSNLRISPVSNCINPPNLTSYEQCDNKNPFHNIVDLKFCAKLQQYYEMCN